MVGILQTMNMTIDQIEIASLLSACLSPVSSPIMPPPICTLGRNTRNYGTLTRKVRGYSLVSSLARSLEPLAGRGVCLRFEYPDFHLLYSFPGSKTSKNCFLWIQQVAQRHQEVSGTLALLLAVTSSAKARCTRRLHTRTLIALSAQRCDLCRATP